ncbi:MAG TPA: nitronate monooxygenase [Xanthobacteraceae bacterium]|nr:nitronate monooxygenase [Xanthobacteraceae bacterium]
MRPSPPERSGVDTMLRTPLCDLFGIDVPIILAPMGTCTSAELAAAVSNAGGLGGIGTLFRTTAAVKRDIEVVRTLTSRPFAVNHIPQTLDAEAFRFTLEARPAVISFTLADPGDELVRQAHDVGARVMIQVTTVTQAVQAAERGADAISAQGSESGGYCGEVSTMALVPQVVDAVSPIPVVASGGIFDGRGIAAALMLGACGVNLGTRFIASAEAPAPIEWKQAITEAQSEDAIKVDVLNDISPLPGTAGFHTVLRSLHTSFLDEWSAKREQARRERDRLRAMIVATTQAGRQHECLLTAGQTVGGIAEILPVKDIMNRLAAETEAALSRPLPRGERKQRERADLVPNGDSGNATTWDIVEPDSLGG